MTLPFNALSIPDAVNVSKARTPSEVGKDIVDFLTRFGNELSAKWPTTDGTWPFRSMADVMVSIPERHMKEMDDLYSDTRLPDISAGARIPRQIRLIETLEFLGNFFEYDDVVMTDTKSQYTEKMDVLEYLSKAGMWWPIDFNAPKGTKYIEGREILRQMTVDTHRLDRTPVPIWDTEALALPAINASISLACFVTLLTVPIDPVEFCSPSLMAERSIGFGYQATLRLWGSRLPGT